MGRGSFEVFRGCCGVLILFNYGGSNFKVVYEGIMWLCGVLKVSFDYRGENDRKEVGWFRL